MNSFFRHRPYFLALTLAASLGLLVGGCTTAPRPIVDSSQLGTHWSLSGKVGCRTATNGGSASFFWQQNGPSWQASFSGPMGFGRMSLAGSGESFSWVDSEGNPHSGQDAQGRLESLGVSSIPIASLAYWLRALPDPALNLQRTPGDGFVQQGWRVSWQRSAGDLPQILEISTQAVSCRVAARRWQLLAN